MANLAPVIKFREFDDNGNPLAGGKLYTYQAGTTTPQATYTDSSQATPNANPLVLDAAGRGSVWLDPELSYKFVLKDSNDVTIYTVDGVVGLLDENTVATASLQDLAVTTAKLADNAVTSAKLSSSASVDASRAVTTDHIRDEAVTSAKVADGAVSTTAKLSDGIVTHAKLSTKTSPGATAGVGEVAVSASSGAASTSSTSFTDVTNLSVTIETIGRPVKIGLIYDSSGNESIVSSTGSSTSHFQYIRDGATTVFNNKTTAQVAVGGHWAMDLVGAGTYTYKMQFKNGTGSGSANVFYVKLVAYEE